jgi:hypothetical protein
LFRQRDGAALRLEEHVPRAFSPLAVAIPAVVFMAACSSQEDRDCPEQESKKPQAAEQPPTEAGKLTVDNAFYYNQLTGAGEEIPTLAYVLFEYPDEQKVKYQVAYVACTCRGPSVNFYSVAYVELSRADGSIAFMSYRDDSSGHYRPGAYGDSTKAGDGTPVKELFDKFIAERLIGAAPDTIYAMEPMHGEVDAYTGATVTPNNAVAMLKGLLGYHSNRYM